MDIDTTRHTYSVAVNAPNSAPVTLAHNYAFRTEQAATTSFDHLGQFIDGGRGAVYVCSMTVLY
jgi:hypothetical protein